MQQCYNVPGIWFLIKSGYYIVPRPSTALVETVDKRVCLTQSGQIFGRKKALHKSW